MTETEKVYLFSQIQAERHSSDRGDIDYHGRQHGSHATIDRKVRMLIVLVLIERISATQSTRDQA